MFVSNIKYDNETSALKTLNAVFTTFFFVFVVDLILQVTTIFTIHVDSIH